MRTVTRNLLALLVLLLVGIGALAGCDTPRDVPTAGGQGHTQTSSPPDARTTSAPEPETGPHKAAGSLVALPPTVQPGAQPAAADVAETLFLAEFPTARRHGRVRLERFEGDTWRPVAHSRRRAGRETGFVVPEPPGKAGPSRYRATTVDHHGSRITTNEVTPTEEWSLIFDEEFQNTQLDRSKWSYRQLGQYNPSGSRECSLSDESAVEVEGGSLNLSVKPDPERRGERCRTADGKVFDYYVNGHVSTEETFEFTYGVAAARIKLQRGRGNHGGFWLQTSKKQLTPGDPASSGGEIDVVEFFGEGYPEGGLASFIYFLNDKGENQKVGGVWPHATRQLPSGDAWWRSYHVFSVTWTPELYVFRVDGREVFRTRKGVSGVEEFLILSLLSSDWELPKLDKDSLPSTMNVDWVRVWQQPEAR